MKRGRRVAGDQIRDLKEKLDRLIGVHLEVLRLPRAILGVF